MENKEFTMTKHLPKRLLSLLLVLVMVFQLLPMMSFASADAASDLADAVNAAKSAGRTLAEGTDYSVSTSGSTITITDKTANGYIWNIAVAFQTLYQSKISAVSDGLQRNPVRGYNDVWSAVSSKISNKTNVETLLKYLAYYTAFSYYNGKAFSAYDKYTLWIETSDKSHLSSIGTATVKVTRDISSAMKDYKISGYDKLADSYSTTLSYSFGSSVYQYNKKDDRGKWTGTGKITYSEYLYMSSGITNTSYSDNKNVSAYVSNLKAFINYGKSIDVINKNGFTETLPGVAELVNTYDLNTLKGMASKANTAKTAYDSSYNTYSSVWTYWCNKTGSKGANNVVKYITAVNNAYTVKNYYPDAVYLMAQKDEPVTEKNIVDKENDYTAQEIADLTALYNKVSNSYGIINKAITDSSEVSELLCKDDTIALYYNDTAVKAYVDKLAAEIDKYDIRQTKRAIDELIAGIEDVAVYSEEDQAAYGVRYDLSSDTISDAKLADTLSKMTGYKNTVDGKAATDTEAKIDGQKQKLSGKYADFIKTLYNNGDYYYQDYVKSLSWEIERRNAEVSYNTYYDYFIPFISETIRFDYSGNYATYITGGYEKLAAMKQSMDYYKSATEIGQPAMEEVFAATKDGYATFYEQVEHYLNSLVDTAADQLDNDFAFVLQLMAADNNEFNYNNFSKFKIYYNSIKELYELFSGSSQFSSKITDARKADYTAVGNLLTKYEAFMAAQTPENLLKNKATIDYSTKTRYTTDADFARSGEDEDYLLSNEKISNTISLVDKFLTSNDFARVIEIADEEKGIVNLHDYIEQTLSSELFSDEMVNKIMALVYPKLTELIEKDLMTTISEGISLKSAGLGDNCMLHIYIGGTEYTWSGGSAGTIPLYTLCEQLGLNVYPGLVAKNVNQSSVIAKDAANLTAAYDSWDSYRVNKNDKESDVEFNYDWGIDEKKTINERYSAFCSAISEVFSPIEPILRAMLTSDYTYSRMGDSRIGMVGGKYPACGYITDFDYKYSLDLWLTTLDIPFSVNRAGVFVTKLGIEIKPLDLYGKIWIPIMEALGLNTVDEPYTFKSISANTKMADIVDALFSPILEVVNQFSSSPVEKIVTMLPTLAYLLTFDQLSKDLEELTMTLGYDATEIEANEDDVLLSSSSSYFNKYASQIVAWLANKLKGLFSSKLKSTLEVDVGKSIDLNDILDTDITDINELLKFLLEKLGFESIKLPQIDISHIIRYISAATDNYQTQRTSGKRIYLTANKADIFYNLLTWVFANNEDLINGVIDVINSEKDPDEEALTIDESIGKILETIKNNPDTGLAAIVELMNPQEYAFEEMSWFDNSAFDTANKDVVGYNPASTVYLNYGNSWTKEKAQYVAENLTDVIKGALIMAGVEEDTIEKTITEGIASIFTNKNITSVVKALASLGDVMPESLVAVLADETGVDLAAWSKAFGYLFDDDEETVSGEGFSRLTFAIAEQKPAEGETAEETPEIEYEWSLNDETGTPIKMADGDGDMFSDILSYLLEPFAPLVSFLFFGHDIKLFADAVVAKGYSDTYANSMPYLFNAIGVENYKTPEEFKAAYESYPVGAINYLIDTVFGRIDEIINPDTEADPKASTVTEMLDILPDLIYFIESDGISTVVKNLLHPVLVLVDTVRPILGEFADIGKLLSTFVDAEDNTIEGIVLDEIKDLSLNDLSLETLIDKADAILNRYMGVQIKPIFSSMFRVFCTDIDSATHTSKLDRADTITLLITSVLEFLQYGNNAENIDAFLIEQEKIDGDGKGILAAISSVFNAKVTDMKEPNWAYTFMKAEGEGYSYNTEYNYEELETVDLSAYHTINYLKYNSDWKDTTADYLEQNINNIILSIVNLSLDEGETPITSISELTAELKGKLFSADTFEKLVTPIQELLNELVVPKSDEETDEEENKVNSDIILDIIKNLLGADLRSILDFDPSEYTVTDSASFADALYKLLKPLAPVLEYLLLGENLEYFTASGIVAKQVRTVEVGKDFTVQIQNDDAKKTYTYTLNIDADGIVTADAQTVEIAPGETKSIACKAVSEGSAVISFTNSRDDKAATLNLKVVVPEEKKASEAGNEQLPAQTTEETERPVVIKLTPVSPVVTDESGEIVSGEKSVVVLHGAEGYAYGLIPLLEALGCDMSEYTPDKYYYKEYALTDTEKTGGYKCVAYPTGAEQMLSDVIGVVCARIDEIINDPVNKVLDILPNLIYFINSNGLSVSVYNTCKAAIDILNTMSNFNGTDVDIDSLIGKALDIESFNINDLSFEFIFKLIDKITTDINNEEEADEEETEGEAKSPVSGLDLNFSISENETILSLLETFYIGSMQYYTSANGRGAFRMVYNETEGRAEMLTILFSFVLEAIGFDKENAQALDALLGTGTLFRTAVSLFGGVDVSPYYKSLNTAYYLDETGSPITDPEYFSYLYSDTNDWTKMNADYLAEHLKAVIDEIIKLINEDKPEEEQISSLAQLAKINIYSGELVKSVGDLLNEKLAELMKSDETEGAEATANPLITFASKLIGCDIMTAINTAAAENDDTIKDRETFVAEMTDILTPLGRIISFLCLGESYTFFEKASGEDGKLVTINGGEGYEKGIKPLLTALGCDTSKIDEVVSQYNGNAATIVNTENSGTLQKEINKNQLVEDFISELLDCICTKIDEFMKDPVNVTLDLLPELIYFVNAGGIQMTVYNLIAPLMAVVDTVKNAVDEDGNALISEEDIKKLTDPIDELSFSYFLGLLSDVGADEDDQGESMHNGIVVPEAYGEFLDTLYFGRYNAETGKHEYAKSGIGTKGDMITMLVSMVLEIVKYKDEANGIDNASALDEALELEEGSVDAIIDLLEKNEESYKTLIAWNTLEGADKTDNFLKTTNDWDPDTADYIVNNIDSLLAAIFYSMQEGARSLEDVLEIKVFSAKTLNSILDLIRELVEDQSPELVALVGNVIGYDFSMIPVYTDEQVYNRETFEKALVTELCRFEKVLKLIFMDQDITVFRSSGLTGQAGDIITINGADGYSNAIVPILEALGCTPKSASSFNGDIKAMMEELVGQLCGFLENYIVRDISAAGTLVPTMEGDQTSTPIKNAIELIPNIIYFINCGGLTTCVNNLIAPIDYLIAGVTGAVGEADEYGIKAKTLNDLIDDFDLSDIDFEQLFTLLKDSELGVDLLPVLSYFESFNLGEIQPFVSANGDTAYRMVCTDAGDVLTTLLCILGMAVNTEGNAEALDTFYETTDLIVGILKLFNGTDVDACYVDMNRYYFDSTDSSIAYLDYGSDWEKEDADYITDPENLEAIIDAILEMVNENREDKITSLSELAGIDLYTNDLMEKLAEFLNEEIAELDPTIISFVSELIGCNFKEAIKAINDAEITDRESFISSMTAVLEPVSRAIEFLCLGEDYRYLFNEDGSDMIVLNGGKGYEKGIKPLLKALHCSTDKLDAITDIDEFIPALLNCICDRIDEFMADPVGVAIEILPDVIYYVNAGGIQMTVYNLIAPLMSVVKNLPEKIELDISEITEAVDQLSFSYFLGLLEESTGIEVPDEMKTYLDGFFFGELRSDGTVAYTNYQSAGDLITILASMVVELVEYKDNAKKLDREFDTDDTIQSIVKLVAKNDGIPMREIDWQDVSKLGETPKFLGYDNDWDEETAKTVAANIDQYIADIFDMIEPGAASLEQVLDVDIFSAKTLNKLVNAINDLVEGFDPALVNLVGEIIDCDLYGFKEYSEASITGKKDFEKALVDIICRFEKVLKAVLFDEDITVFVSSELFGNAAGSKLITINGTNGYAYGIVPILEAIGRTPKAPEELGNFKEMVTEFVSELCDFVDEFAVQNIADAKPINKAAKLLPNIIYFINSDGLTTSVNNLFASVDYLLSGISAIIDEDITLNALIEDFDLEEINFTQVFDMLEAEFPQLNLRKAEKYILKFNVGTVEEKTSANGSVRKVMSCTTDYDAADVLTTLIGILGVALNTEGNAMALDEILFESTKNFVTVVELIAGLDFEYSTLSKDYFEGINNYLEYLSYSNDWQKTDADYIYDNLESIISEIIRMINEDSEEKIQSLSDLADINIYTNDLMDMMVEFLNDNIELLDSSIIDFVSAIIGCDLREAISEIRSANITDRTSFVKTMTKVLNPVARAVSFICLDADYRYFDKENGDDLIVIHGGKGYEKAIKPILEALGCDTSKISTDPTNPKLFISTLLDCICNRIDDFMNYPVKTVLDVLPGVIYFINAGGIKVSLTNLMLPLTVVADKLSDMVTLDLSSITEAADEMTDIGYFVGLLEEETGITVPDSAKSFLKTYFFGVNGEPVYYTEKDENGKYTGLYTEGDMITILASLAIEILEYGNNAQILDAEFETDNKIETIVRLLSEKTTIQVKDIDWMDVSTLGKTDDFLRYSNNWNDATAEYIAENIEEILSGIFASIVENSDELSEKFAPKAANEKDSASIEDIVSLEDVLGVEIFSENTMNKIIEAINDIVHEYDIEETAGESVTTRNNPLIALLGEVIDCDLYGFEEYEEGTINSKEDFETALIDLICSFEKVLKAVLFDEDITVFVSSGKFGNEAGKDLITINGSDGYTNAIVPILEALEIEPKSKEQLKDFRAMITESVTKVCDFIDDFAVKPINNETMPIQSILENIPNIIYFINSGGLTTCVNNLIAPVDYIFRTITGALGEEKSLNSLIEDFDLDNIEFEQFFSILLEETADEAEGNGLDLSVILPYIESFNVGTVQKIDSLSKDKDASRMVCTVEYSKKDVMTTLLCLFGAVLDDENNAEYFRELMGDTTFAAVKGFFHTQELSMLEMQWLYTDDADFGKVFSIFESTEMFAKEYGDLFTEEKAQYIEENLDDFLDNMTTVVGIEVNGESVDSFKELVAGLVGTSLYTRDNIESILEAILEFMEELNSVPAAEHIKHILLNSLGVNLFSYDGYSRGNKTIADFEDGDRDAFMDELTTILRPLYPVLEWLLCDKNISFLTNTKGTDAVTLYGAEGYRNGVIPVLEALFCEADDILTQAEYYAAVEADKDALVTAIVEPLFNKLDYILEDPANRIFDLLPNLWYFINSKGLDTCWKNLLNPVYNILNLINPALGEDAIDLYEMMDVRLDEMTFQSLLTEIFASIEEEYGYQLEPILMNFIAELTTGTLVSFDSKVALEGETVNGYRMIHSGTEDKSMTITTVMRIAVKFIGCRENADKIKQMLKENDNVSDTAYRFYSGLIDVAFAYSRTDSGIDTMLYMMYSLFTGTDEALGIVKEKLDDFNTKYQYVFQTLFNDENPGVKAAAEMIEDVFGTPVDGIVDETGLAPDGILKFMKQSIALISKLFSMMTETITNFFNSLSNIS